MDKPIRTEDDDTDLRGQDPAEGARDVIDHELARMPDETTDKSDDTKKDDKSGASHPAGPHARPDLTDNSRTPGAGTLAEDTPDTDPGAG